MDGEAFFGDDTAFAPVLVIQAIIMKWYIWSVFWQGGDGQQGICDVLLALILVGALQRINGHKFLEGLLDGARAEDVDAEVEDVVERVAVVTTALTGHP